MTEQTTTATKTSLEKSASFESFDEREIKEQLSRDTFQKELDKAIEEYRLAEFLAEHDIPLYDFDAESYEHKITVHGVDYKARVKNPSDEDEMRKEAMSVIIRRNAGKFEGDDLVESYHDNSDAMKRYFDGTALEVWGYPINDGDDPEVWRDVRTVVTPGEELSDEDAHFYRVGHKKDSDSWNDLTLLHVIPEADKIKFAEQIHGGRCFVIHEKGKRITSVRKRREYFVKQLFGALRDDDGTLQKPTGVVAYKFREAGAKALGKFKTQATPAKTRIRTEGQPEERSAISIPTCKDLFADHIVLIQGACVKGAEVKQVEENDARLKSIPAACQRDASFVYLNFLKS